MKNRSSQNTNLDILMNSRRLILVGLFVGFSVALSASLVQPLQYRSRAQVLIIPNPLRNQDAFQASRSAERYAKTLENVLPSASFYRKVVNVDPEIQALFHLDERRRREEWQQNLQGAVIPETGILRIESYGRKRENAQQILSAVLRVLEEEGSSYLGGYVAASIYPIDSPIASQIPVRPNYFVNLLGGIAVGGLVSAILVLVRSSSAGQFISRENPFAIGLDGEKAASIEDQREAWGSQEKQWTDWTNQEPWLTVKHVERKQQR